jgi:hypothetical protein
MVRADRNRSIPMRKIAQMSLATATAAAFCALASGSASAQNNRSFVSGQGSDSNPCSLAAPCRTFAQAVTQTNANGEIAVLDTAGYGPFTITQSVTITNPGGVEAGVTTTSGGDAITIDTTSTAAITLRGLTLEGGGVGGHGVFLSSGVGGTLNIIDCVVKDFTDSGIAIQPSFGTTTALIADTYSLNNGGDGIKIAPASSGAVRFSIIQMIASGDASGIDLDASGAFAGSISGVIADSHADYNSDDGIKLNGIAADFNVFANIKDSYAISNKNNGILLQNTGLSSDLAGQAGALINNDYFIANNNDFNVDTHSTLWTFGNNVIGSSAGSLSPASLQ